MMSRILSQSLSRASIHSPKAALISHHRHRSNKTHQSQLIEVELDPSSSSQSDSTEVITVGIKKLEEAIQSIIVRRAAPDWLPFRPGYSYWVPPQPTSITRQSTGMVEVISKLTSSGGARNWGFPNDLLSADEEMSFTSAKGWPSSAFFIEGIFRKSITVHRSRYIFQTSPTWQFQDCIPLSPSQEMVSGTYGCLFTLYKSAMEFNIHDMIQYFQDTQKQSPDSFFISLFGWFDTIPNWVNRFQNVLHQYQEDVKEKVSIIVVFYKPYHYDHHNDLVPSPAKVYWEWKEFVGSVEGSIQSRKVLYLLLKLLNEFPENPSIRKISIIKINEKEESEPIEDPNNFQDG